MQMEATDNKTAINWIDLIQDAQTDPEGLEGKAILALYYEIYGYLGSLAKRWLKSKDYSETEDGLLLDIGTDTVLKALDKFACQSDDPEIVRRQFLAWIAKICRRQWSAVLSEMAAGNAAYQSHVETVEADDTEGDDDRILVRTPEEKARLQDILNTCLGHYPENVQQAILATTDLKDSVSSTKRGRTGEAAMICEQYGVNQSTVRVYKKRVMECAKAAYAKEVKK